jgi:hypothetical protein
VEMVFKKVKMFMMQSLANLREAGWIDNQMAMQVFRFHSIPNIQMTTTKSLKLT